MQGADLLGRPPWAHPGPRGVPRKPGAEPGLRAGRWHHSLRSHVLRASSAAPGPGLRAAEALMLSGPGPPQQQGGRADLQALPPGQGGADFGPKRLAGRSLTSTQCCSFFGKQGAPTPPQRPARLRTWICWAHSRVAVADNNRGHMIAAIQPRPPRPQLPRHTVLVPGTCFCINTGILVSPSASSEPLPRP